MCIHTPCPDPTQLGVWWRDDTCWRLYSAAHQTAIRNAVANGNASVDLGLIASAAHPQGASYIANITQMKQRNFLSGYTREIKILNAPVAGGQAPSDQQNVRVSGGLQGGPTVHWRNGAGQLQRYTREVSDAILRAAASGRPSTNVNKQCQCSLGVKRYSIDLVNMTQKNLSTGKEKDIIIQLNRSPSSLLSLALASTSTSDRRQLIYAALDIIREEEHLERLTLDKLGGLKLHGQRRNPYLKPGSHLFERFIDSMDNVTIEDTRKTKRTKRGSTHAQNDQHFPFEVVFHGTPEQNIDSILQNGMDPKKRHQRHEGDWFAYEASVSRPYCHKDGSRASTSKMLLFFVLKGQFTERVLSGGTSLAIVSSKPECQLPVAEITVK